MTKPCKCVQNLQKVLSVEKHELHCSIRKDRPG